MLIFYRWCQIFLSLLRLLSFRHLHMNFTLTNLKLLSVFCLFCFFAFFNPPSPLPSGVFLSKQECTIWVGLLLAVAYVEEWWGGRIGKAKTLFAKFRDHLHCWAVIWWLTFGIFIVLIYSQFRGCQPEDLQEFSLFD